MSKKNLVMLAIMDGYGIRRITDGNAIANAHKPNLDQLFKTYPNTLLDASGEAVGLPEGQMGNSEVGHMNIGAGRTVFQSFSRVNNACKDGSLLERPAIDKALRHSMANNSSIHIMGLLSDGGVHSHIDHIIFLAKEAKRMGIKNVYVHCFLDGRDVPPKSAKEYLTKLANSCGKDVIGVVSGRYYAMDRDKNYDRTQLAYDALVHGLAPIKDYLEGIDESYNEGITDEFVKPFIVNPGALIKEGDSVIYANFRPDRAIQLAVALTNPTCAFSDKATLQNYIVYKDLYFVQMMLYSDKVKADVAFGVLELPNMFGEVISNNGLKQLRIAETEKYAHVTFFFDGGEDKELVGAKRILVASPKVATYDMQPEMSAYEVCSKAVKAIKSETYDTIILNFANCDMVGHTTSYEATIKAVEVVDECMGKLAKAVEEVGGTLVVTADHGNADEIWDENHLPFSAHTTSKVPLLITKKGIELKENGTLGDIAPTMLELLGIPQPVEMTGQSLIKK